MKEGHDFEKLTLYIIRLKKRKPNMKDELVEKYKKMDPDLEQNYYSRTTKSIYRVGHDKIRIMKWMA